MRYIQQDWQGSVRTVTNGNGFVVSRTDHQAFGGEVGYGVGKRTIEQGYNVDKATRQGYGLTERDDATGLDHTWFRKNESNAGRWTSPDPYKGSMSLGDPQSFNRYSYVQNQPTNFVDPSGLDLSVPDATYGGGILWTLWYGNNKDGWTIFAQWFEPYPVSGHEGLHSGGGGENGPGTQAGPQISDNCADELARVGLLGKVQKLFSTAVVDVNGIENDPASDHFGKQGTAGLKAGEYFDQHQPNAGGALTFIGRGSGVRGYTDVEVAWACLTDSEPMKLPTLLIRLGRILTYLLRHFWV